ncbi:histidine kinase [Luteithermobacter gelatinilyticus]|uniref:histidine kinase n=1 Tax=Luteithermobacter gelatinilyticus TaxID=2582913 RepID=UPI001105DAD8|nr:histidine kinase [Luteithermobacter gelatinilyticus]
MTHFLKTAENPEGYKLEDILHIIRKDIIKRATLITDDDRPEARHVLNNNITILGLLSEAISIAEDSSQTLERSFGPHSADRPRIGKKG